MKSLVVFLVAAQLSLASAFAAENPALVSPTPEFNLIASVIALQGEELPARVLQNQLNTAVSRYLAIAPRQQMQERFEKALVDLQIYTPAEAASFMTDLRASSAELQAHDAGASEEAITGAIEALARLHPVGARFSSCQIADAGLFGALGVAVGGAASDSPDVMYTGLIVSFVVGIFVLPNC